jgi:hypothetical protein
VTVDRKYLERRERELKHVEKRLSDYDSQFLKRLDDLLKRKVLSESEFEKAHKSAREESTKLAARRDELKAWLNKEHDRVALVERLPRSVASFIQGFQSMDVSQQKVQLQTILKTATIYNDGRIELEFRE